MRALVLVALLAGCAATAQPSPSPPPASEEDTCGIARHSGLIGTLASEIDLATLPPRARIIHPDSIVTMDYSAERLNVITGTDGRVGSLRSF